MNIFIAKSKNHVFYLDIGEPPSKNFSKNYQSGPLSFEYFLDGVKIITNCGFGSNISSKAELISRLTASQTTLTINDTSITKFERNKLVNRIFGNSIKSTFKTTDLKTKNDGKLNGCSALHNGYEKNFGCLHKREIYLDLDSNKFIGSVGLGVRIPIPILQSLRIDVGWGIKDNKLINEHSFHFAVQQKF